MYLWCNIYVQLNDICKTITGVIQQNEIACTKYIQFFASLLLHLSVYTPACPCVHPSAQYLYPDSNSHLYQYLYTYLPQNIYKSRPRHMTVSRWYIVNMSVKRIPFCRISHTSCNGHSNANQMYTLTSRPQDAHFYSLIDTWICFQGIGNRKGAAPGWQH